MGLTAMQTTTITALHYGKLINKSPKRLNLVQGRIAKIQKVHTGANMNGTKVLLAFPA